MKTSHARRAGAAADKRRKARPRPVPKWLKDSANLDAIARSRCLMVLSVLSGEKPVTEAIREAKISRGTYYQLEVRALKAMLVALNPLATVRPASAPDLSATRIEALMGRIQRLEQGHRRDQRLLLLTRKSLQAPVTTGRRGRLPRSAVLDSMPSGSVPWPASKARGKGPLADSSPMRVGATRP